jgi:uncharacterized protein (DUF983 family)
LTGGGEVESLFTFFTVFGIVWVLGGLSALLYLSQIRDPTRKRKAFVWITVLGGVVFSGFLLISLRGDPFAFVAIAMVALITALNLALNRFCPRCAAWNYNWTWVMPMKYCRRCGADLRTGGRGEGVQDSGSSVRD